MYLVRVWTDNDYYCSISNIEANEFFHITFKYSVKNKINIYLFADCKFNNYEFVQSILINKKEWVYHYYIPFLKNKNLNLSNILIVGFLEDVDLLSVNNFLNPTFCINSVEQILNIIKSIDWDSYNIYDHSCKWSNQEFFADFLDFISYGDINLTPPHWYMPNNSYKFFNFKN